MRVQIVEPGDRYIERLNQIDFRDGKILRYRVWLLDR